MTIHPGSSPIRGKTPSIPAETDIPSFVIRNGKKYAIEEKTIHHGTVWKIWQGTQAFFLTLLSLCIGLAFQSLRDKWKKAITGDEKIVIYTRFPSKIPSTFKTSQVATHPDSLLATPPLLLKSSLSEIPPSKIPETGASSPKDDVIISSKADDLLEPQEINDDELRNFIDAAKKDITKISITDLEKKLNEALKASPSIQDPEDKTTILTVAERVAQHYIKASQFNKATEVRMRAAQKISLAPPLSNLQIKLQQEHPKLGVRIHPVDTSLFKNHTLVLQKRKFTDGKTHLHLDTRLSHPGRTQLQTSLDLITSHPNQLLTALPTGFCTNIKVTSESIAYQGRLPANDKNWEGDFSSNIALNGFKLLSCKCQVIDFEGVGKVKIGTSSNYLSEYNRITIDLDPSISDAEAPGKLNILFATLGLGAVSSPSRVVDMERIKIMQLFRAFYPKEAYTFEREAISFEESVESLKARIGGKVPEMNNKFQHYLVDHPEDIYQQEVYPGQPIWCIKGLAEEVKNAGGIGLMAGVTGNDFNDSTKRLMSMLKTGALSSQDRFQLGVMTQGASSEIDLRLGGGESVFARMLTNSMPKQIDKFPLASNIQILYDLKLVERVGYAYSKDKYGSKSPAYYGDRSNIVDLTKEINADPTSHFDNEICIHNRVGPEFVKGIRVNTLVEKNQLIDAFREEDLLTKNSLDQECFNGVPIDEFIHIGDFKAEYWA